MEDNYILEKEYRITKDILRDAYLEFQKKFVYPKNRIYMIIFAVFAAAILIFGALNADRASLKQKYIMYIGFVMAVAFSAREWFNPRKIRRKIVESSETLGEPLYRIEIAESYIDISTVSDDMSGLAKEDAEICEESDPLPDKTRLTADESLMILEYDRFFLILSGKEIFYILPKEGFSEDELNVVRNIR